MLMDIYFQFQEENKNMEDKMNKHDNEMRAIRKKCEELMSENNELNSLINEVSHGILIENLFKKNNWL